MPASTHQTVRLCAGRHPSPHAGACVMELASMLAAEPFSDRPHTSSPVIGAFLRTYNDGLDDERRQDLYPLASLIVGSAASRRVEAERASRCLAFARRLGGAVPGGRAGMGMATPEAAGTCAGVAALRAGAHGEALAFARELAALGRRRRRLPEWLLGRDPAVVIEEALEREGALT
ncbi:MAG TPA: hypothetical protein VH418_12235 [Solirubrobacteraceae bacterium]|jgi:hypothetical protein